MITITELEDEIIKNKEAANIFIEKINDKKNEIHEKMKHPLDKVTYNENLLFVIRGVFPLI